MLLIQVTLQELDLLPQSFLLMLEAGTALQQAGVLSLLEDSLAFGQHKKQTLDTCGRLPFPLLRHISSQSLAQYVVYSASYQRQPLWFCTFGRL